VPLLLDEEEALPLDPDSPVEASLLVEPELLVEPAPEPAPASVDVDDDEQPMAQAIARSTRIGTCCRRRECVTKSSPRREGCIILPS
jgi:hypothetical protein